MIITYEGDYRVTRYASGAVVREYYKEKTPAEVAAENLAAENAQIFADLAVIDAASIRSMREYIASKADAPQILKDKETAATLTRAKLK